jgi:lactate dehydrogenase-like 2-hydroxyacid dehydrogenase
MAEQPTVLVVGPLHPHAIGRLQDTFVVTHLDRADPTQLPPSVADQVRAIACVYGAGAGRIDGAFMDALPTLEIIANFGVGYDGVDAEAAATRGVVVTNTPDVLTDETADTAVGLLLNTVRELSRSEQWLRDGRWAADGPYPLTRGTLRGRHVGILGLGRIGRAIAGRLEGFGLPISYHNRTPVDDVTYAYHPSVLGLAHAVDTLVVVLPGGDATRHTVNAEVLAALGPQGVLINIGRGTTVDEAALVDALSNGTIMAAGLDVFEHEPHVPQALLDLDNATLLPHVGSASVHTREAMADLVVDNLVAWFAEARPLTPVPETAHLADSTD